MGSQTLEILRQGVWASLTGGWFYDPHQDVFCNAVHLYLWLFLLCTPFVTYLYFSKTVVTWIMYCLAAGVTISMVKIINLLLHVMYDRAQTISNSNLKTPSKGLNESHVEEDGGIEMQVLGTANTSSRMSADNNNSNNISHANSALSFDYQEQQVASTIDLKVDVHRKNSSESSDSIGHCTKNIAHSSTVTTHSAEICQTVNHRRSLKIKSKSEDTAVVAATSKRSPISEEAGLDGAKADENTDQLIDIDQVIKEQHKKKMRSKLQRQISLDAEQGGIGLVFAGDHGPVLRLQRHRSSESNDEHPRSKRHGLYHQNSLQQHLQSVPSDLVYYIPSDEDNCKLYIDQQKTPMRKDSNSTMSALQLPTMSNLASSNRLRRHSNTTGKQGSLVTVRRIKSAALETCCPQPSVSNLSPHPNSVEAIGGQTLRNPQHAVLPPPSKCLVRNPHLNLYPRGSINGGNSSVNGAGTSGGGEHVYPIAEMADEKNHLEIERRSKTYEDVERNVVEKENIEPNLTIDVEDDANNEAADDEADGDDDDDDETNDDDDDHRNHQAGASKMPESHSQRESTTSESDLECVRTQSTSSDTENAGSRSPLLDVKMRTSQPFIAKQMSSDKKASSVYQNCVEKTVKKTSSGESNLNLSMSNNNQSTNTKSEDSGCPSSDCDQVSASSKDMLLTKEKPSSERMWFDFSMDSNNISVDVTDPGEGSSKMANEKCSASVSVDPNGGTSVATVSSSKSLGAIPKRSGGAIASRANRFEQYYDEVEEIIRKSMDLDAQKSLSRASSSASSRRFSGESYDYDRPPVEVLHQTKDGWTLQTVSSKNPATAAARGDPPPLIPIYTARHENMFPSAQRLAPTYVYYPPRRQQPKIRRSTRNRTQNQSFDAASTSRDEENQPRVAWDYENLNAREPIDAGLLLQDLIDPLKLAQAPDKSQPTGAIPISIGGVEYESVFCDYWRHYNLPPEKQIQPKRFYKFPFHCFGKHEVKITMDRLQLQALFDRDLGWFHVILAIFLGALVSILGSVVLRLNIYKDIFAFIFCFVIAGSQYSLLKSVQPDAASPIHGFNKTVAYSRPIYFCFCSSILVLANHLRLDTEYGSHEKITLFALSFVPYDFFLLIEYIMSLMLLLLPIFFSLGLFPQVNTFFMYMLEQIDMHIFGGNAVCSLIAAFVAVFRSLLACCLLYGPVYGSLAEPRGTQHVLFSCFCALLIAVSYHLSRSASDFTCLWSLIKSSLVIHTEDDEDEKEKTLALNRKESSRKESDSSQKELDNNNEEMDLNKNSDPETVGKEPELEDPLPKKLQTTVNSRLKNDFLVSLVIGILVMSLHSSTVFTLLQPELNPILHKLAIALGFLLHYVMPQMRKHLPWLCIANPVLRQKEHGQYEASDAAKIMWFETTYVCLCFFERNILYPLIFLSTLTADSGAIYQKFGLSLGAAIVVVCGLKCVRSSYSEPSTQFLILIFSVLFFERDYNSASETFLIDYFMVAIVFKKACEFLLKLQFIVTYIAPWQITWGSAFHAFAQPFSVPHSAMLFLQAAISAILSTPLNPFLGSAIFLTSYVRPIKFWERDYNTRRIDHSNTRLSSQLERDLGADDNNLNSIFYEHLTRSLQHSLCGDLLLGRWGNVSQGDCFVLASDYLNCLVHIIELGNGLCTFQMRGLEFRGTYCQQREVEAISEGIENNQGCCCCLLGHLPNMLSVNAIFSTRWLAWQVIASKYILEGYSISDNLAQATLQVFEFRKVLITYYVKSIIFYTIRSQKLHKWLQSTSIQEALQPTLDRHFVDLDPIFNHNLDEDFDFRASGITRASFCSVYMDWIQFCCEKRYQPPIAASGQATAASSTNASKRTSPWSSTNPTPSPRDNKKVTNTTATAEGKNNNNNNEENQGNELENIINMGRDSSLVSLLLALGILARRTLATASSSSLVTGVEFFLHGLHALFKGDFRITSSRDEWVFADMDLLHSVVAPAVKMALKLHQDHFLSPDEYDDPAALYKAITTHTKELVISHEADPLWRNAVLRGAPNLLTLRHVMEDGSDEYRLIRLTKRFLSFRVIKLNRECVRGLWAGQQQELIYLRNRNPERGSIQNAKQALRNIINSSCDQPIGYPIYVSPLTTSYAETNQQLCSIIGGAITLEKIHKMAFRFCQRVRQRCSEGCSSGSATLDTAEIGDIQGVYCNVPTPNNTLSGTTGTLSYGSQSLSGAGNRGSMASMGKPTSSQLFAGFLNRDRENSDRESVRERSTKRRSSVIPKTDRDRERRVTLPVAGNCDRETSSSKEAIGGSTTSELKQQISADSYLAASATGIHLKPNNSFSAGHLGARNSSGTRMLLSADRQSKSEERHSSREKIDGDEDAPPPNFPPPPQISLNRKVIIVDSGEIYDCLDLGRRIDVIWPNENMRSSGGRSSWKEWTPQEGMVGFVVHYWQPNHPDNHFRSNFNRTLFLIQIGERFVPVGENGVKEYNTIGADERIKIVHIPRDELKLDDEPDIPEEKSEASEDYVSSADHSV